MARRRAKRTISEIRRNALKCGYRSGLEVDWRNKLKAADCPSCTRRIRSISSGPKGRLILPDFKIVTKDGGFFYVEGKGIFSAEDRHKHLLIKEQTGMWRSGSSSATANAKFYRNSPTSYADWCRQHGFQFADKTIPENGYQKERTTMKSQNQQDPRSPQEEIDNLG